LTRPRGVDPTIWHTPAASPAAELETNVRWNRGKCWRSGRRAALWLALVVTAGAGSSTHALEVIALVGEHDIGKQRDDLPIEGGFTLRFTGADIWRSRSGIALVPSLGGMATEENAYYGWVGGALFIPLGERWALVPEVGAGAYERGDGKNLGGTLEFRTGLEVGFRASDAFRIGVGYYHLSNAGVYEVNPGVNSLVFTFGFHPKPRSGVGRDSS
jgi:hypothetical protein